MTGVLVFPNQLYTPHPCISKKSLVFLIEHPLFFGTDKRALLPYLHIQKKLLHKASMDWYQKELEKKNISVIRITHQLYHDSKTGLLAQLKRYKITNIQTLELDDTYLEKELHTLKLPISWIPSPGFYLTHTDFDQYQTHSFFHQHFYKEMRKRTGILMKSGETPVGDKWSFDEENRKKLPNNLDLPQPKTFWKNKYVQSCKETITGFGTSECFIYPTTRQEAKKIFHDFLDTKLTNFGPYQDAIDKHNIFGFHSLLSSSLNIGLLTPTEVVKETLEHAKEHKTHISSVEGFIRQIIGWREFIRLVYRKKGTFQRTKNHFHHQNILQESWYKGTTNIEPLDDTILKAQTYAYAHHIERLMIAGNLMLLAEIHPDSAYRWFMELFIDAYDWVMVPNVYGMALYADGGLMTTKPYISSSNYIRTMSHYKKGQWCETWDALYWRFIYKHKKTFEHNPRMKMMILQLNKKSKQELREKTKIAEAWIQKVTK